MPASSASETELAMSCSWVGIQDMLSAPPPVVDITTPLQTVVKLLQDHGQTGVFVEQQGQLLGALSEAGLIKALATVADLAQAIIPSTALIPVPQVSMAYPLPLVAQILQETELGWLSIIDDQGRVAGILTQQRLETALRHSLLAHPPNPQQWRKGLDKSTEIRFWAIFEQMNVGVCQASLEGQLMDANPGLCQMLGYDRDELVAKSFQDITHPADLNLDLKQYEQLLAGRQNSMFVEKRYIHKDGHAIWVALTVCLVRNTQGQPLFSLGVSQDISDRKATELALKVSHQHITNILESITDAFFALDHRWRFTYLNGRAEQFYTSPEQSCWGKTSGTSFPKCWAPCFRSSFARPWGNGKVFSLKNFLSSLRAGTRFTPIRPRKG
jgi:PAS domain S-box-containing protein